MDIIKGGSTQVQKFRFTQLKDLKNRDMDVAQTRRMIHDKNKGREFLLANVWGLVQKVNPST